MKTLFLKGFNFSTGFLFVEKKKSQMEFEEIRKKVEQNEYEISFHAEKERYAEDIAISDLENVIYNGEILEEKRPKWINERRRSKSRSRGDEGNA